MLACGDLTMTGGTINGDTFAINGPVTINAGRAPAIISVDQFQTRATQTAGSRLVLRRQRRKVGRHRANVNDWGAGGPLSKNGAGTMILNGPVNVDDAAHDQRRHAGGQ